MLEEDREVRVAEEGVQARLQGGGEREQAGIRELAGVAVEKVAYDHRYMANP